MNNYHEFTQQIRIVLDNAVTKSWGDFASTTDWTKNIKRNLGQLGREKGYEVCTAGFLNDNEIQFEREWLYDIVWYQNNEDGKLLNVPFIAESEWIRSVEEIKYDFEKLLQSNAQFRLMICQAHTDSIPELKRYFKNAVSSYSLLPKGSPFLIAILDDYDTGEFQYELILKE